MELCEAAVCYYSSAFKTIVHHKLDSKFEDLGLSAQLRDWILNFLANRPQVVRMGQFSTNVITYEFRSATGLCLESPTLLT